MTEPLPTSSCGKFFEGEGSQMLQNVQAFLKLPPSTLLCCGHEYSVTNLMFVVWARDPDPRDLQ